ncbi:ATP-binding protein [Flavobacterium taihuense]|uniref:histidine kinase n=1 Tax=Flavobacterium taihuense TaxID=2857508 RepID=A0ABS6XSK9_9FLAO|nr:sensor histidine kinase [Flavobacterium taihuense]MBW4359332.1 sensor histidine kinase [Flavobacterium taihuense]
MKIKLIIFSFTTFLSVVTACQKKEGTGYKKRVISILNNIDTVNLKNSQKVSTLDTLNHYLLNHENDSINRNLLFKVVNQYYYLGELEKYKITTKEIFELASLKKDKAHIAKSLYYIGNYHYDKSQYDSAYSYYNKSEKLYAALNDSLMLGTTSLLKGSVLLETGNYAESESETVRALRLLSKVKRTDLIYNCYNQIAISLKGLNNYNKSLDYFNLTLNQLDILEKEKYSTHKILKSRINCYNNIGRVYEKMGKYTEAMHYYDKGLQTNKIKKEFPRYYAMLLDNLGYSKMKTGNYNGVHEILIESLRLSDSLDIKPIVISNKINIGQYFLYKKDTIKALTYIKEGFSLSRKIKYSELTLQSLKLLMENDTKNKTYYTNEYLRIDDSLQEVERITRNKFARIAYETDLVEEKNQVLLKRNTYIIGITSLAILFFAVLFIIYRLKSRNKELFFIKEQQEANEKIYQLMLKHQSETEQARKEERNRIAMELHDGIVNSVFTTRFNLIQLDSTQIDKKEQLVKELEKTENEIRRVSHDLTQNLLFEDKSFPEIVANLVESQQNQYNTKFDVSVDKYIDWSSVSSASKIHIYRIIQEALQNSNKYSKAERCYIMLLKTADKITIRIWDNGIGFNTEKVKRGIGLKNIKDRTKTLNGQLKITSEIGKGTTIEVVF